MNLLVYIITRLLFGIILSLPYKWRVPFGGWLLSYIVAPVAGYRGRVHENLTLIFPEMTEAEKRNLMRSVPNNVGRTLTELFSASDLVKIAQDTEIEGPGYEALKTARKNGQPSIIVSGHFGNYDIARAALIDKGFSVGGLYKSMNNRFFNAFYVSKISKIGKPLFLRGRQGLAQMLRFLKGGGTLALLIDQHMRNAEPVEFFGHKAYTGLSAAQMALKYNAVLVPIYAIRQPDGLSFRIIAEAPIEHSNAEDMTQALNDSLEARVRKNMDQWMWIHRRWKD